MDAKPVNLRDALASFDDVYSPRIVATMNDYDVRVAHVLGEHVWHVHENTDEFFLVLEGRFDVAIRDESGAQTTVSLGPATRLSCHGAASTSRPRPAARS